MSEKMVFPKVVKSLKLDRNKGVWNRYISLNSKVGFMNRIAAALKYTGGILDTP